MKYEILTNSNGILLVLYEAGHRTQEIYFETRAAAQAEAERQVARYYGE